jgi:hypothetical protein
MIPRSEERPTLPLWPDACEPFGLGRSAGYELAARGAFPCKVLRVGRKYRVVTADLRQKLGLEA